MRDIEDYIRRQQFVDQIKAAQVVAKRSLRETLEDQVEAFVKKGGKVEELPPAQYVPRQPCTNPEPYPKRKQPKPYHGHKYNKLLREWCDAVEGRAKALAKETGYSDTWVFSRRHGVHQLILTDWEHLEPIMERIERIEHDEKLRAIAKKHAGGNRESEAQ